MRNKNKTVWSHRLGKANSKNFQRIGSSIKGDKRLYNEDIHAAIVHTQMRDFSQLDVSKEVRQGNLMGGLLPSLCLRLKPLTMCLCCFLG